MLCFLVVVRHFEVFFSLFGLSTGSDLLLLLLIKLVSHSCAVRLLWRTVLRSDAVPGHALEENVPVVAVAEAATDENLATGAAGGTGTVRVAVFVGEEEVDDGGVTAANG